MKRLIVKTKLRRVSLLVAGAGALLCVVTGMFAEQTASQTQAVAGAALERSLKVLPLAGDGEENDLERHILAPIVVEVLDRNDMPVLGADVVFHFPTSGPGAFFSGQKTTRTVKTNAQGEAAATDWTDNGQIGKFTVQVAARYGNQIGDSTFTMANVPRVEIKNTLLPNRKKSGPAH